MELELDDITDEISNIGHVSDDMVFRPRVKIVFVPGHWRLDSLISVPETNTCVYIHAHAHIPVQPHSPEFPPVTVIIIFGRASLKHVPSPDVH